MQKTFSFIILFMAICFSSFSQLKFGFKAGLNVSTISNVSYSSGYNRAAYFNVGITTRKDFSKRFYFSPQLLFSEKGFSERLMPSGTIHLHLNYISLPLYCGFKLTKGISFKAGPEISYLVSAKGKTSGSSNDITDFYNRIDVSISSGLNIKLGKQFFTEVMFDYGMTNVIHSFGASFPATGRNNVIQFNVGYYLK
ncbi:hypothetical protein GALL_58650 [mine drainage metagenome]|uniref:Outer membrane protein beta-barrel domain-containing protein n=1 Tax=mine drainage metagenome TaxID=410659 RepID=A0A1J5TLB6_9ZZZZ